MNQKIIIAACAIALAALPVAFAGEDCGAEGKHPGHHGAKMEEMDGNGDGKISLEEFQAGHEKFASKMFEKLDADGDGAVTKDEMKAAREKHHHGHHGHHGKSSEDQGA